MDCHMPQSSRGTPLTKMVPGRAGLVVTRKEPWTTKLASYVVVAPAEIVTSYGAGTVTPYTPRKETVYVPGASFSHARPHSSRGTPFTRTCAATAGFVVTRSMPYVDGSGPSAEGFAA